MLIHARDRPKLFYAVCDNQDGTVDVYLNPDVKVYNTDLGIKEYDARVLVVRGVTPWPEIEEDIRARYNAWCESAEAIDI